MSVKQCPEYIAGTARRAAHWTNWTRRRENDWLALTRRASVRARARLVKAASISRPLLALKTWICKPMARAAVSTPLTVDSVLTGLAGLTRMAIRVAVGT